ncbi:MAG: NAD(P)/FAD-dependent oxidoreductase [Ktedonobacteraceae bacterium]
MQSSTNAKSETSSSPSRVHTLQKLIPWWQDIDPAVYAELQLSPVSEAMLQPIDVVVIGGGVAGLSAALAIKERDAAMRVLVLERAEMLGYGATGRNAGIFTPGINMAMSEIEPGSPALEFYPATTAIFHRLIEEGQKDDTLLSVSKTGAITMATSKRAAHKLERETRLRVEAGLRAQLWTPAQVNEATQGRLDTKTMVNAMWLPDEGRIQPLTLLAYLAHRAREEYAVEIAGQARVTSCEAIKGQTQPAGWQITLADGTLLQARALVNCMGPTVEANARIYALAFKADFPGDFPLFWDASPYTYADYRPGNGRLGVSGGRYGKAGGAKNDDSYYQHLADATRRWVPELRGKRPAYRWAVDLYVTADLIPVMRVLEDGAPGVAIEGLGAHGVLPGIMLARQAANYLVAQLSSI